MISLNELLELPSLNQLLNSLLQITTFVGVVVVILVEMTILLWIVLPKGCA